MPHRSFFVVIVLIAVLAPGVVVGQKADSSIPTAFVAVTEVIPTIIVELRYYSPHNFIGKRIQGYQAPKCYLTEEAAFALEKVQNELLKYSLSLKIYDAYRPQRAVNHFVTWAKNLSDTTMKREFYPEVEKKNLFRDGYIASRSGHSRGSTVDLTIVPLPIPEQEEYFVGKQLCDCTLPKASRFNDNSLDMGTGYDCFDKLSWTGNTATGTQQFVNRLLLKTLMEKYGFRNYAKEWWHYTLKSEPFPDTYFDFVIE